MDARPHRLDSTRLDEVSQQAVAAGLEAPLPEETQAPQPATEGASFENAVLEPSLFRIEWQDLAPNEDTNLTDAVTTVALRNGSDAEAAFVLRLVGDHGTSKTDLVELGETVVAAGATVIVAVDLSTLYSGKTMSYAGHAHISANVMVEGIVREHVVGDALFYHPEDDGVVLYDEAQLIASHAAGDILNLAPEALSSEDPEDQATVRISEFEYVEPKPIEDDLIVEQQQPASQTGPQDLATSSNSGGGYPQKLCVRFEVETVDSGYESASQITEDVWADANDPVEHKANYVRVKIGGVAMNTNSSGCVTFTTASFSTTTNVRVWAMAEDTDGNYVRAHNGSPTTTASYPGSTHSWLKTNVYFHTTTPTILPVGYHSDRATMMEALARSLHRYSDGMSNTEIHVAEDPANTGVNLNYFNDYTNDEAYISIRTQNAQQRSKFIVAHEYGHAYLQMTANSSAPGGDPGLASLGPGCIGTDPNLLNNYHSVSEEWSSTAFAEGYAHFISARIWNHKAGNGWFNFGSSSRTELEKFNPANDAGGHMVNTCCEGSASCTPARDGHGVIFDWLRALWDMHDGGGGCSLDKWEMMAFFSLIVNDGPARDEYYGVSETMSAWFGGSCTNWWEDLACHNGINMDGSTWSEPC